MIAAAVADRAAVMAPLAPLVSAPTDIARLAKELARRVDQVLADESARAARLDAAFAEQGRLIQRSLELLAELQRRQG